MIALLQESNGKIKVPAALVMLLALGLALPGSSYGSDK